MNDDLIRPMFIMLAGLVGTAKTALRSRAPGDPESGVSTLEMVIIALGLIAVATLLVTAITIAVTRRTSQIQ